MKKTKIIAIANQKGGVGKTTTTVNVGVQLSNLGYKVLLVDFDPQGNMSSYLGYEYDEKPTIYTLVEKAVKSFSISIDDIKATIRRSEKNNVDYIPADITLSNADICLLQAISRETVLKRILTPIYGEYDFIFIDCLPALSVLLINSLTVANYLIIPVQTEKLAFDGLIDFNNVYEQVKNSVNPEIKILGVLPTMVKERTKISKAVITALSDEYGNLLFKNIISNSVDAPNSTVDQKAIVFFKKSKIGNEYIKLTNEIIKRINTMED